MTGAEGECKEKACVKEKSTCCKDKIEVVLPFYVIYQTQGRVFHMISKHREVGRKNES